MFKVIAGFRASFSVVSHQSRKMSALRMHQKSITISNLKEIFTDAVDSVKPQTIFQRDQCLKLAGDRLTVTAVDGQKTEYNVAGKRFHVVGFGKAVYGLAVEVEKILKDRLVSGIISVPVGTTDNLDGTTSLTTIQVLEGARNNLPDNEAFEASKKIVEKCSNLTEDDVLICLVSGGGSALLTYPKSPLILAEKSALIKTLANRGACIEELNTVRIALSEVKGGRLAEKAQNAHQIISLIISDICLDPIDLIASGPTVYHENVYDACEILKRYNVKDKVIRDIVSEAADKTTARPQVGNFIIASNKTAIETASKKAETFGYRVGILSRAHSGDVRDICDTFENLATETIPSNYFIVLSPNQPQRKKGICLLSSGEATVKVTGSGVGGRNQELALRFARHCTANGLKNVYLLSGGTDGLDGPTDAAGAIGCYFDENTENPVEVIDEYINRNDSYNFYKQHSPDTHLITGHTGTNVMDLHILVIKPGEN